MGKVLTDTAASTQDIVQWCAHRGGLGIIHEVGIDALGEIEHRGEEGLARREGWCRITSQARTTRDVGRGKEVWHGLQHCSAARLVQHGAYRFPGWSGTRLQRSAWRDFDRAPGGHCQRLVWFLHGKKSHSVAKKVHIMAIHTRLWQHDEFIVGAGLLSALRRSEI